jgi:hypothetical protein
MPRERLTTTFTGTSPKGAGSSAQKPTQSQIEGPLKIDLKALAEKVYQLLKEEARLERERLGRD